LEPDLRQKPFGEIVVIFPKKNWGNGTMWWLKISQAKKAHMTKVKKYEEGDYLSSGVVMR
jgi:hypothetical protein